MKTIQKLAMQSLQTLDSKQLISYILALSNRIDLLEKFIDEETFFSGEKVGKTLEHGPSTSDWYKDEFYQIDGTIRLPNGSTVVPNAKLERNV